MTTNATREQEPDDDASKPDHRRSIANAPCEPESPVPQRVHIERELVYHGPLNRERVRCTECAAHIRYADDEPATETTSDERCTECKKLGQA